MIIASNFVESWTNSSSWPGITSTSATDRRRFSELLKNALQQSHELSANAARRLHHLGVIEGLGQYAGRHVGDARDAEHLEPHVTGSDRFGDGGHADRVGPD